MEKPADQELRDLYDSGLGVAKIGAMYHVGFWQSRDWLIRAGVTIRPKSPRRYPVEAVLEFLSTSSGSFWYILGYLFADGCLRDEFTVSLTSKDKDHLELVRQVMGWTGSVMRGDRVHVLVITSKEAVEILKSHGLTQRKSLTMLYPNVPSEFKGDFIRGYFDGDGSVSFKNLNLSIPSLRFSFTCAAPHFLASLEDELLAQGIGNGGHYQKPNQHAVDVTFSSAEHAIGFARLIYGNNPVLYMERKWRRFAAYLAALGHITPSALFSR